jgi:hypothetical protein
MVPPTDKNRPNVADRTSPVIIGHQQKKTDAGATTI